MELHKLKDSQVKAASAGKLNDGGGLTLRFTGKGKGHWYFRYSWHGRRPEMGLGAYPDTSLKAAREAAAKWRAVTKEGKNPLAVREAERRALSQAVPTFEALFFETFDKLKPTLKGGGKAGRWDSPVRLHILPQLGSVPIDAITQRDLERVLKPIWQDKPDVARKALNRVNLTIQHAAAGGLDVDMQLTKKTTALLGKQRDKSQHIPSMPWQEVPAFYRSLEDGPPAQLALRFLILTGLRSGPVRELRLEHFLAPDLVEIPADHMKSGKAFRVPLSSEAQRVIELAKAFEIGGLLFPGQRNRPLSDMTLTALLKRRQIAARPHGFRSSLRVWLAEATDAPDNIRKAMLAHAVGDAVSQAYERTDYLEQRRVLLERWGQFLTISEASDKVVRFVRGKL